MNAQQNENDQSVVTKSQEIDPASKSLTSKIKGTFDKVDAFKAKGWAIDMSNPDSSLDVELVEGDLVHTVGKADQFRPDLLKAGLGDGKHSFEIELPACLADRKEHVLRLRVAQTGDFLAGEILVKYDKIIECGDVKLEGKAVVGWASNNTPSETPISLVLYENGKKLSEGLANKSCEKGLCGFRLLLPDECFDGRPHAFIIHDQESGQMLSGLADILPAYSTPYDVLQRFIPKGVKAFESPSAQFRYESLLRKINELANSAKSENIISSTAMINAAHQQLVQGFESKKQGEQYPNLIFNKPAQPDVSIVIPVHNKFPVTYHCLASIFLTSAKASFEVIVVDDGSEDDTLTLPELVSGIEVVRNEKAQGFVRASNLGATRARGKFVVMLNNDTEVTPDWLDELIAVFQQFDNVGLAGAKLLYPNGKLQEAGGIVWGNGQAWNYGRNGNAADPKYNYVRQVDYISGACIMLPKKLWDELGGFDEYFAPAYYEDNDLAFRVRAKGLKTVYTHLSQVIHFEGMSSGTSVSSGTKRYQKINEPKFKSRWSLAYHNNGQAGREPDLAKDRNVTFRALVIDAETPQPDRDAGSYAAIQEMRLLQSLGFKLTFIPQNLAYFGTYTEALERMGIECAYAPYVSSVHELLERRGKEFDVFYITRYSVAEKVLEQIRKIAPDAKIVFNNADLHFLRELRLGIVSKSQDIIQKAVNTRDAELGVMRNVDVVLSYNETEHAVILSHNLDSSKVARCPWVVEISGNVPAFEERRDIAFLGGFGHYPNVEAIEFFVSEVMPLLIKKAPDIRLLIYGSRVPEHIKAMESDNIVIKGYVESVAEVYDTARLFVAPLKSGAGLKGKVAGALAHGIPSILSPVAAEGIGLRDGLEVRIVNDADEWINAISELYTDKTKWDNMSSASISFAKKEFSFEGGRELMAKALQEAGIFPPSQHNTLVYQQA